MKNRFNVTRHKRAFSYAGITFLLCLFAGIPQVNAEFDPVNDDTDIFLANPNVTANRPNVLIYVDNTANWNSAFTNEKSALKTVVDNLSDGFNVGLMLFPETGGGNDSVDGGYVRFAIRQMTDQNKTVLSSIVNGFDIANDKGNNATTALGMAEVYRYFSGSKSRASHGKVKTDHAGNTTHPARIANIGSYALPASPTANSNYTTPIADICQSNFLIYISNGPTNENANALSTAQSELSAAGYNTSSTISLTPNGQQGNWMDEWSKFMANADINPDLDGMQNLTTYVVEVDPATAGQGDDMTALMKSVALNGNGEYFAVSSGNAGQAIVNALTSIFREIQAVNSVFASTTLPVSVNVRGTNLNQVYIGVFRPDDTKSPRWFGNLKMYQLGFDDATSTLFLADAAGSEAENPETGFINSNSASFWTESSSYWNYRTADENGSGGASDLPDGDLVEKGGTAQQQRMSLATDQTARRLYTCTSSCGSGDSLSATPFSTANAEITAGNLQLNAKAVSTLTGFETKDVTALSDTKKVQGISLVDTGLFLTSLSNTAASKTITALTSNQTRTLTGLSNNQINQSINSLTHPVSGASAARRVVTATISGGHGLSNGATVTISGAAESGYNGTFVITYIDAFKFSYNAGSAVQNEGSPATGSPVATTTSSVVTATANSHGFASGASVVIAGVSPTSYNGTYQITKINDNSFSFTTASSLTPINTFAGATATGPTLLATASLAAHGYADNSQVTISGANEAVFNGTHTIDVTGANNFTFPITEAAGGATGTILATQGGITITGATSFANAITIGDIVTIAGANVDSYNGVFTVTGKPTASSFTYSTSQPLPPTTLDSDAAVFWCDNGSCSQTLAVVNNHRISNVNLAGFPTTVNISGANDNLHTPSTTYNGNSMTPSVVTGDSFLYPKQDASFPDAATGDISMRYSVPLAFVTLEGHGYSTGDQITVAGADQSRYNGIFSAKVIDTDTFFYQHAGSGTSTIGNATGTITASKKTTIARVRAVNHGFSTGNIVTISGASPSAFNGNFTITKVDDNNFTYDLTEHGSIAPQGNATGTIVATTGSVTGSELTNLVDWVRGQDNIEDENSNSSLTDVRASIHGDVLHSRPAVINYNRHGNDDDVYVFYGANDGIFRAVKGGFSQSAAGEPEPGQEAWGFIPEEFFPDLQRLRNNEPKISSANKKPYFADGTIAVLAEDNSGPDGANVPDGKLDTTVDDDSNPDRVQLFISMRRGGRFIYALDVSDPDDPKFMWKKSFGDPGMAELGYSWSAPRVVTLNANDGDPVLLFGAGYDPSVEDVTPGSITSVDSNPHTAVTAGAATYTRTMGRGIFALDAGTGDILWQAGPAASDPTTDPSITHHFEQVDDMDYAIPSDMTIIRDRNGSVTNRAYVGDTGGNLWRIDMNDASVSNWKVSKLASLADHSILPEGNRKLMFPPDVVYSSDGYDAVILGSGDREHPFDETVINRFYMIKDPNTGTSVDPAFTVIEESDLFDTTSNCIQDGTACSGTGDETDSSTASDALSTANGWYITMAEGEKIVGNAVTLNNVTFFNTNQPGSAASVSDCSSDLGIARQYKVRFDDATAIVDQNIDGITDAADRSKIHAGGGYLPSPVPVVVEIDGQIHEGVISGVAVDEPPGSLLNARLRRFWYKEME